MKPFQIVVMAVFGILALIGLYVFANFSSTGGVTSVGKVTVWGLLPPSPIQDAITSLSANNSAYKGVTYTQKNAATFDNDLAQAIATGNGPDLVLISQEQLISSENKLALIPYSSIPQRTFLDSYAGIFQLYLTSTGTYGVPLVVDPLVLYYNKTLLQDAGVVRPPVSWEELPGLTASLTKTTNSQTIQQSTLPFGGYANVANARAILSALLFQAGTPITGYLSTGLASELVPNGSPTDSTPAVAAVRFYTQFADPAKTVYSWNPALPNSKSYFLASNLAFYPGFASELASLRAGNPNVHLDMAPLPQAATSAVKATYGVAYAFAIPKASSNATGAFTVAFALTAPAVEGPIAKAFGLAPASSSLLAKPDPADPYAAVYYPAALIAKGWLSPPPSVIDSIFAAMISNVTSGRNSIPDAIVLADRAITAALQGH